VKRSVFIPFMLAFVIPLLTLVDFASYFGPGCSLSAGVRILLGL